LARNGTKWHENHVNDGVTFAAQLLTMGADKTEFEKPGKDEQHIQWTSKYFFYVLATFAVCFIILFKTYIFVKATPDPKLSPKETGKLEKRLREIDDSEQYALKASVDGWYACLHSNRATVFLRKGEVWKYGVTSKGEFRRYNAVFLAKNRVFYFVEYSGTFSECLKQEQIKLFNYPYLPENLTRPFPERLPRPPFNSIMR
jgi:hypothetical protein